MSEEKKLEPETWVDAVRHVCTMVVLVAMFYCMAKCHGATFP